MDELRVMDGGPTAPKGEADLIGSAGASFHASLGDGTAAVLGIAEADTTRGEGLNEAALALSIRGDRPGDPPEEYPEDGSALLEVLGDRPASLLRESPEAVCGRAGVLDEDTGVKPDDGDCGRSGVIARNEGTRLGVYGRSGRAALAGDPRTRLGVGVGLKGTFSWSSTRQGSDSLRCVSQSLQE